MEHPFRAHEKIRFRRDDIVDLGTLPSAAEGVGIVAPPRRGRRVARVAGSLFAGLALLVLLVGGGLSFLAFSGVGTERLRAEAEHAVTVLAGFDVDASLGSTSLSFDGSRLLALEVGDVRLVSGEDGAALADAGTMRFGLRIASLIGGQIQLGDARISDARIEPAYFAGRGDGHWSDALTDARGLVDPDRVLGAAFAGIDRIFDALAVGRTRDIELENVTVVLPESGESRVFTIHHAAMARRRGGLLSISADIEIEGRTVRVEGTARRSLSEGRISDLQLTVASARPDAESASDGDAAPARSALGGFELAFSGAQGAGTDPGRLAARLAFEGAALDLGAQGLVVADGEVDAELVEGAGKVEVGRALLSTGRSRFEVNGAFGPTPVEAAGDAPPAYRYEFITDRSTLSAEGVDEPALVFAARLAGRYLGAARRIEAEELAIRTGAGALQGRAAFTLAEGAAPGIDLDLSVQGMPVSQAKQLWPWFAAAGARRWVLANVHGGRLAPGTLSLSVPPGRLGDGEPLTAAELSASFPVEDTRFDIAGDIPPVRSADGVVAIAGMDIEIALSSGTSYMPSGRPVDVRNGRLLMRDTHRAEVFGALEIDVEGETAALTELASRPPIDVMRHLDLSPEDFSGRANGRVEARIPLRRTPDTPALDWSVALDFEDLAIARPFDGQTLTEADGTIEVDRERAVIRATGKLNGAPSTIAMVEPLDRDAPGRSRDITMELDDRARSALVPGLDGLLSGPVSLKLDASSARREIVADLGRARLDIPWTGWTKGAGIPASVSFALETSEGAARLSDFQLTGDSFSAAGSLTVSDGRLAEADFSRVRLNRGDDVSLAIARAGDGYAIRIRGRSLDARSLVKQVLGEPERTVSSGSGRAVPVSVDAEVETVLGFHDERLANMKLTYEGVGASVAALRMSAVSAGGGGVALDNVANGSGRTVRMQSTDAGAVVRFLDIYRHMQGGRIDLSLAAQGNGPLRGTVDARDFHVVDEPRLAAVVSTPGSDGRSLNTAVNERLDTSRVAFERGYSVVEKGPGYLSLERGVLRGPTIGTTFQGTVYDAQGNMDVTGTFMPAYGVNRIFGEIPLLGVILGNGRDRGLIGITFRLAGRASEPRLQVNPLSAIAPGVFRSIFEFR